MIGYNLNSMEDYNNRVAAEFESIECSKTKALASMYKVIFDFDESKGIQKDVFTILFTIASLNEKNTFSLSDKNYMYIFNNSIIHKLNRSLYNQNDYKSRIDRPGEIPSWILYGIEKISSGDYFGALSIMAMHFKADIDSMLVHGDKLTYFLKRTSLFTSEKMITFERILNACRNYTPQ